MKRKKFILVLGKGPVLTMAFLLLLLAAFLVFMFFPLRRQEPGLGIACLFFALISCAVSVLLLLAYFTHRKEDQQLEAHWAELERHSVSGGERRSEE